MLQNRKVETLPSGVSSIQLWLWSATPSLTILIAGVEWDEDRGDALDRIAKKDYPSIAVPSGTGHSIYSPFFHKRLEAERCRKRAHEDVESWLRERVPGAFTDLGAPMPTLDVITSARYRPFADEPAHYHDYREALSLGRWFGSGKANRYRSGRSTSEKAESRQTCSLSARELSRRSSQSRIGTGVWRKHDGNSSRLSARNSWDCSRDGR
jgi:hypothetical protein